MKKLILHSLAILLMTSFSAMTAQAQLSVGGLNQNGADVGENLPAPKKIAKSLTGQMPDLTFYIWAISGPERSQTNEFNSWSSMVLDQMFDHGFPLQTLSNQYAMEHVMRHRFGSTNRVVWFAIRAISTTNNILASGLSYVSDSSDNDRRLRTSTDLSNSNTVWSPALRGLDWGGSVARSNAIIYGSAIAGRINERRVKEVDFIGAPLPYFTFTNTAGSNQINVFILSHSNFMVSGRWNYVDSGMTNAYVMKSLGRTPVNFAPRLGLWANKTNATASVNGLYGNSVVVLHRPQVVGSGWSVLYTGNPGDSRSYRLTGSHTNQGYFRIQSQ